MTTKATELCTEESSLVILLAFILFFKVKAILRIYIQQPNCVDKPVDGDLLSSFSIPGYISF